MDKLRRANPCQRFDLIRLILILLAIAATQSWAQNRTTAKGHDPEHGRDLAIRMERLRTCEGCPEYEIKIFVDGRALYDGKDAVTVLGKWGNYLLPTYPQGTPGDQLQAEPVKALVAKARQLIKKYAGNVDTVTTQKQAKHSERVVIELPELDQPILNFDYSTAPQELRDLVTEIERFFVSARGGFLERFTAPTPAFFADRNALFYWSFPILSEVCRNYTNNAGVVTVRLYDDGRIRIDYLNVSGAGVIPGWPYFDTPVIIDRKPIESVKNLVRMMLAEWKPYLDAAPPRFEERRIRGNAHMYDRAYLDRAYQKMYVKLADGRAVDLTAARYDLARTTTSPELTRELDALAVNAVARFELDHSSVKNCLTSRQK